jgi:hypothetical protein
MAAIVAVVALVVLGAQGAILPQQEARAPMAEAEAARETLLLEQVALVETVARKPAYGPLRVPAEVAAQAAAT